MTQPIAGMEQASTLSLLTQASGAGIGSGWRPVLSRVLRLPLGSREGES